MSSFHLYAPIIKIDKENRTVEGYATSEDIDQSNEVVDYDASKRAFADWKGNVREMHQPKAVGKAIEIIPDDERRGVHVRAYISKGAEDTWEKILDGTLQGYSIGGSVLNKKIEVHKSTGKQIKRITDYKLSELSLVDNPCNIACGIQLVKLADDDKLDITDIINESSITKETPDPSVNMEISKIDEERSEKEMQERIEKLEKTVSELLEKAKAITSTGTDTATTSSDTATANPVKKAEASTPQSEAEATPGSEGMQNKTPDKAKPKNTNMKPREGEVTGAGVEKAAETSTETETETKKAAKPATETSTETETTKVVKTSTETDTNITTAKPVKKVKAETTSTETATKTCKAAKTSTATTSSETSTETKSAAKSVEPEDLKKSIDSAIAPLKAMVDELKKQWDDFAGVPLPRKAAKVIEKHYAANADAEDIKKSVTPAEDKHAQEIQKLVVRKNSGQSLNPEETFALELEFKKMMDAKFNK